MSHYSLIFGVLRKRAISDVRAKVKTPETRTLLGPAYVFTFTIYFK